MPTPAPAVVINQPVVTQGPDSITLLPISSSGAAIGVAYLFDMPHCGVLSPIDVDGSFWDAVGPANSIDFGGQSGSFQLSTQNSATFTTSDGQVLNLVRHPGSKAFGFCE